MPWKTGRGRTLSATGTISGQAAGVPYTPAIAQSPAFTVTAFGCQVGGQVVSPSGLSGYNNFWSVSASCGSFGTGGTGSASQTSTNNLAGSPTGPNPPVITQSVNGSYSIQVEVEEWVDFVQDPLPTSSGTGATVDTDLGIYRTPPRCTLTLFECIKDGSTITAEISCGGVSATASDVVSSSPPSGPVDFGYGVNVSATLYNAAVIYGSYPNQADDTPGGASLAVTVNTSPASSAPALTGSGGGITATCASGISISLPEPYAAYGSGGFPNPVNHQPPPGTYASYEGAAASTTYPDKVYSVAGALKSVADPFPGSIPVSFSLYSGDPSPLQNRSDGWSASYSQSRYGASVSGRGGGTGSGSVGLFYETESADQWQPIGGSVDAAWCRANGESVTYQVSDDAGNTATRYVDNSNVYLHAWSFGGVSVQQAASLSVDNCQSAAGWANATEADGGLTPTTPANAMVKTFAPVFDFSGYRYLNVAHTGGTGNITLSLGGKTWTRPMGSGQATMFDLCDPDTGGASTDTLTTKWPLDSGYHNVSSGPLSGVSSASSLSLKAPAGVIVQSISQVQSGTAPSVNFMTGFTPRPLAGDVPMQIPPVDTGGGSENGGITTTAYAHRGLVCYTDGKASLEWNDVYVANSVSDNMDSWSAAYWPVKATMLNDINTGQGTGNACGWSATTSAPDADGSLNIYNGFLNSSAPAWTATYGLVYAGAGWRSGIDCGVSFPQQILATVVEFYPGCGDAFGLGPSSGGPTGCLYAGASWRGRSQCEALVMYNDRSGPAISKNVTLYPATGEPQSSGTGVGSGVTNTQGYCRTAGDGLDGYTLTTFHEPPNEGGGANPDGTNAAGSRGVVADMTDGSSTSHPLVTQTFYSRFLSWVGLRAPRPTTPGANPSNHHGATGRYLRVKTVSGAIQSWRSDQAVPSGGYQASAVPVSTPGAGESDAQARVAVGHRGDVRAIWARTGGDAPGAYESVSTDGGKSWTPETMAIPNATHPGIHTAPNGTVVRWGVVAGRLLTTYQAPGMAAPSDPATVADETGAPLSVADDVLGISAGYAGEAPWMLHVLIAGETDTSDWKGNDSARTFKRLSAPPG